MFKISNFTISLEGEVSITINERNYKSRFHTIDSTKLDQLSLREIKELAYDLVNDFYNPNIPERTLSIIESINLQKSIINFIINYILN